MTQAVDFEMLFDCYLKSAENVITHFDDDKDTRDELLEKLKNNMQNTCFHALRAKKVSDTVRALSNNIEGSKTEDIMKAFSEQKQTLIDYKPNATEHTKFKDYCQQVTAIVQNADGVKSKYQDDDIEMTQSDVNVIDPFTKKRMTDPVKNKLCGHIYDRHSVTTILKMNSNTRCPVVGCSHKESILMENMIPDLVTRKYLHDNPA